MDYSDVGRGGFGGVDGSDGQDGTPFQMFKSPNFTNKVTVQNKGGKGQGTTTRCMINNKLYGQGGNGTAGARDEALVMPEFIWEGAPPSGIDYTLNGRELTLSTTGVPAGTYQFRLKMGNVLSQLQSFTVLANVTKTVTIGAQVNTVRAGTNAITTYAVKTANMPDGTIPVLTWVSGGNFTGITTNCTPVKGNRCTVVITSDATAISVSRTFRITADGINSANATYSITASANDTVKRVIILEKQSGTLFGGTSLFAGISRSATFAITSVNTPNNTAGSVQWRNETGATASAPVGITVTLTVINNNMATATVKTSDTAVAGNYYFSLNFGGYVSNMQRVTVFPSGGVVVVASLGEMYANVAGSARYSVGFGWGGLYDKSIVDQEKTGGGGFIIPLSHDYIPVGTDTNGDPIYMDVPNLSPNWDSDDGGHGVDGTGGGGASGHRGGCGAVIIEYWTKTQ
jgi:hypothetical protein